MTNHIPQTDATKLGFGSLLQANSALQFWANSQGYLRYSVWSVVTVAVPASTAPFAAKLPDNRPCQLENGSPIINAS